MVALSTVQVLLLEISISNIQGDQSTFISWLSLGVSVGTFIYTMIQVRNQHNQIVLNIIFKQAEICNSYIKPEFNHEFPKDKEASVSAVVSAIISAYQIIDIQKNYLYFYRKTNSERLLDTFYLMLHTSIRVYFNSITTVDTNHIDEKDTQATIKKQLQNIRERFNSQIEKYG